MAYLASRMKSETDYSKQALRQRRPRLFQSKTTYGMLAAI